MPSLSPGVSGAKEVYGISVLKEDNSIIIPPKAFLRYKLDYHCPVLLTSTREGECGFAILNIDKAKETVFKKIIDKIEITDKAYLVNSRPYAITKVQENSFIKFNSEILKAFELKAGEKYIVIKSTTVTMSFTPIAIFKEKLSAHGFLDAIKNIEKLEIFE